MNVQTSMEQLVLFLLEVKLMKIQSMCLQEEDEPQTEQEKQLQRVFPEHIKTTHSAAFLFNQYTWRLVHEESGEPLDDEFAEDVAKKFTWRKVRFLSVESLLYSL